MSVQFKLQDGFHKGEKAIRRVLDRLEGHGFLIKKDVKKTVFKNEKYAEEKCGIPYESIQYQDSPATLSVYCFNKDIMLILKARLYMLQQLTLDKVSLEQQSTICCIVG